MKKGGLGRGLDSLFEGSELVELAGEVGKLNLIDVEPNRDQPRKNFEEESLRELSESIKEHGVLQPILVRQMPDDSYQIVAGERRWRAARLAGLREIPVVIKEFDNEEVMFAAMIENLQREDLNPIEEAKGYEKLIQECGLTQEEIAKKLGKSRSSISNSMRLLKLSEGIQEKVEAGVVSAGHAKILASLSASQQEEGINEILEHDYSVRKTEQWVKWREEEARVEAEGGLIRREGESQAEFLARAVFPPEMLEESLKLIREKKEEEERAQQETPGKTKKQETRGNRSSFFDEVELSLSEHLGRKMRVSTNGNNEYGTLVIEFYDRDDLIQIAKSLSEGLE